MVLPSPPRIQCRRVLKVPQAPIATCMVVSATWISLVLIPVRRGNVDEIAQMWKPWRPSTHKMTLNHRAKTKTQKRNPVKTLTKVEKHFNYCILLQTFYLRRYFFVPLLILNAQLLQVGFNFVYIKYTVVEILSKSRIFQFWQERSQLFVDIWSIDISCLLTFLVVISAVCWQL